MIFSYKELKKLAKLEDDIKLSDVVNAINTIGFEVEETIEFGQVEGIKFGKIKSISKNPNGDKLNVCKIEFDDKNRTIQTTATNVKEEMVIIAFIPGSKFEDIIFSAKELKGIISEGMLTNIAEFGIDEDLIRDDQKDLITSYDVEDLSIDPIEFLCLKDVLIDVNILSNRSDSNSYFVMARELSAYFNTKIDDYQIQEGNIKSDIVALNGKSKSLVMIEAKKDFTISIQEQILLAKSKIKSVNDIVDLTNLTLIMTGQPTHAYDKNQMNKDFRAKKISAKVNVLGNKEIELKDDLVIVSGTKIVSVAGVIGIEEYAVKKNAKNIIFELGIFNIKDVRTSIKSVKVNNMSSSQSSKIVSKGTTDLAIAYLSNKLNIFSNPINWKKSDNKNVEFSTIELSKLTGFEITNEKKYSETVAKLEKLGYKFLKDVVEVPSYRHDINSQQDLNEEIFRFYGYDNFEPKPPKMILNHVSEEKDIMELIAQKGYQEVVTYSLISEEKNVINPFNFKEDVVLSTFCSKEREVIRNSLAHSLLEVVEYNNKRGIKEISIFTKGMINNGNLVYGISSNIKTFDKIKQDIINLIGDVEFVRFVNETLHPTVSAKIMKNNNMIGWIGKVHPVINKTNAFVAEFKYPNNKDKHIFTKYDNAPLKHRDITFSLKNREDIANYLNELKLLNPFSIKIIDEFEKEDELKTTIRSIGNESFVNEFDKKYNQ